MKNEFILLLINELGFKLKDNSIETYFKTYAAHDNYIIEVDFQTNTINYGKLINLGDKTTSNFKAGENFVVLECVNRLLEKGYKPQNITLEKIYPTGHGTSGKLDILITNNDKSAYIMIECKAWGQEYHKELNKIRKDGGQLFTYFQQDRYAEYLVLYTSCFDKNEKAILYKNNIIKIESHYREAGNVFDLFDRWNKLFKDNGIFENWASAYQIKSKALKRKDLQPIKEEDSSFIFGRFLEILRHNVVSDKPNAFNKIFTLFLCKIVDENKNDNEDLEFQWLDSDNHIDFQKRLTDLYKRGMKELLEKEVTDISDQEVDNKFIGIDEESKNKIKEIITNIRLKKNNEFAIKEVFDDDSFIDNAKVVKEVVELLQHYQIRYNEKQQYLGEFFELLLTTGLKQEAGQFFTPVPIARFIINSIPLKEITINKLRQGKANDLLPFLIDYACGSGHFLTEAMDILQKIIHEAEIENLSPNTRKSIQSWRMDQFTWAYDYIYGVEKDYRLVKTAKVSCYLHGDGLAKVIHGDGIGNFSSYKDYKEKLILTDKDFSQDNKQFDMVVSNPPYSVAAFKNTLENADEAFEIFKRLTDQSSEIECLFIERTKQLLKDGGLAGIILPSSILSNTGIYEDAREIILKYFKIIAIAEFGSNTFMATGTNTITLFLERRNNYEWLNVESAVNGFIKTGVDAAVNGIERPFGKYVSYIYEGLNLEDYLELLNKKPNKKMKTHEIYSDYQKAFGKLRENDFFEKIIEIEKEKLLHFILAYPQKIVLVKAVPPDSADKNRDEKEFLGYEFSFRRGSEGHETIPR